MTSEAWDSLISLVIVTWDCGETTFDLCKPQESSIALPLRPVYGYVNANPLGQAAVRLYRKWLHECTNEHQNCPDTTSAPLPTRVLDVRSSDLVGDVKLGCIDVGEHGDFIALSYCWGGVIPLRTLSTNLESRRERIPWRDLPKTFQDVVQLARRLDISYIWIDALCIIQDSDDDWAKESARMAEIYGNAALVIIAAAAPTPNTGFLGLRGKHIWDNVSFGPQSDRRFLMLREICEHSMDMDPGSRLAVSDRGWCLQERLMGQRTLIFRPEEVVWECRQGYRCECSSAENGHQSLPAYRNRGSVLPMSLHSTSGAPARLFESTSHAYEFWRNAVEDYTRRLVTQAKDRLPAISALAKVIHEDTGDIYIAGLWKNDILHGLLWTVHYNSVPTSTTREYVAPTWSWARQPQRHVIHFPVVEAYRIKSTNPELYCDAQLVDYGVVPANANKYGAVHSAFLILNAYYCDVEMSISKSTKNGLLVVAITCADAAGFDQPQNVFDTEIVESVCVLNASGSTTQTLQRSDSARQGICSGTVRLLWLLPKKCLVLAFSQREAGAFERLGLYEDTAGPRVPPRMRMRQPETHGGGLQYGGMKLI